MVISSACSKSDKSGLRNKNILKHNNRNFSDINQKIGQHSNFINDIAILQTIIGTEYEKSSNFKPELCYFYYRV